MNNYNNNYYQTYDLSLAAALVCSSFVVERLERDQSRRAAFCFAKSTKLDQAISEYWADKLRVNPKAYFDTIKHLKTRIYSEA